MSQHPLDRLTTEEIAHNRTVLDKAGLVGPSTRFPLVMLVELAKSEVLAWPTATPWTAGCRPSTGRQVPWRRSWSPSPTRSS